MPLPNILEFIGTNVTQAGFKVAQQKLLDYVGVEIPTKTELSSAVAIKADKAYVDSALTSFQNGAIKTYPTLTAGNADIANIALNTKVSVLSETEGGDYYKASANAMTLTKSAYDPLVQSKNYSNSLKSSSDLENSNTNTRITNLLLSLQQIVQTIVEFRDDYNLDIGLLKQNVSDQLVNNSIINSNIVNVLLGFEQLIEVVNALQIETDEKFLLSAAENQNYISNLFQGISTIAMAVSDSRDDFEVAIELIKANTNTSSNLYTGIQSVIDAVSTVMIDVVDIVPTESEKLSSLLIEQNKVIEFSKLDGFDPDKAGANSLLQTQNIAVFPTSDGLIRIDVETPSVLPIAKGLVINTVNTINASGQVLDCFGTLEVQGSSSANFPKKNWTLAFFKDEARIQAMSIKLGHMITQDELVFKSNFVDNTHSRNIAINRLWDQMQMSRFGWPKREPDFVNMKNGVGLSAQPTGATGHVDGFPAVMYINGEFYGLGCLNIGKKRDNYNLKKDSPKHIQLDPEGSVNLYALPATPHDPANSSLTTAAFDVRRPATWNEESQGYYDRLSAFLKMSKSGMESVGIDNYIDRASMMDYIILCQICDLWDHLHKNTLYTTWDGNIWHFLPYDVDTVFGLHFTGVYYNSDGMTELHPANKLIVPSAAANSSWGTLAKFRLIYGSALDSRYAELRRKNIISVENIVQLCENLTRKFPTALFEAENTRWNLVPGGTIYQTLQQTGSTKQIYDWLSIRLPLCDSYFNFSS